MEDIRTLKKQIIIYGGLVALICEVISFFILGWRPDFLFGLAIGLAVAILNFFLMAFFLNYMLEAGNQAASSGGFFLRMILYCVAFYFCIKVSYAMGMACLIGIVSTKVPMFYFYAFKPKFDKNRTLRPEVKAMYEEEDQQAEDEFYGIDRDWDEQEKRED